MCAACACVSLKTVCEEEGTVVAAVAVIKQETSRLLMHASDWLVSVGFATE